MLLLMKPPHFDLHAIGSSSPRAPWKQAEASPVKSGELVVALWEPGEIKDCDVVSSGLDSSVAGKIEMAFFKADLAVFSNAKNCLVSLVVGTVDFGSH